MAERRKDWQHYAAPTVFLAVATIAIVLVASALHGATANKPPAATPTVARQTSTATTTTETATTTATATTTSSSRRFYTVVAGDTFGAIATKTGTSVAQLEQLNPDASSTSLHVGQKLRVA